MIWVTWRQFRAQGITAAAFIAAFGLVLLISGLDVAHVYSDTGLGTCHGANCVTAARAFLDQLKGTPNDVVFYGGICVMYLAPALMGMFWGAPLVARELEAGTFRLAWNQSVGRSRWLVVKLGLIGLAAMATAGLLSLFTGWWASPIYTAAAAAGPNSFSLVRISPTQFGALGIVPVAYSAFGFALGVTAGVLLRRTIPAMAVALAGFAFIQLAWASWIRAHLIAPLRESFAITPNVIDGIETTNGNKMFVTAAVNKPGAWIISNQTVDAAGHPFTGPPTHACQGGSLQACNASIGALHLRSLVSYQPASRFWELQWTEAAIFLALAVLLGWFCTWWVRRRMT